MLIAVSNPGSTVMRPPLVGNRRKARRPLARNIMVEVCLLRLDSCQFFFVKALMYLHFWIVCHTNFVQFFHAPKLDLWLGGRLCELPDKLNIMLTKLHRSLGRDWQGFSISCTEIFWIVTVNIMLGHDLQQEVLSQLPGWARLQSNWAPC